MGGLMGAPEDLFKYPNHPKTGRRWRVRWREPDGRQRARSFDTKQAALAFERRRLVQPTEVESDITIGDLAQMWLRTKSNLRFKTIEACKNGARHVCLEFGDLPAAALKASDVRVWQGEMKGSASLRRQALQALRAMCQLAVDDGLLTKNPTAGVSMPKAARRDPQFMTAADLSALAAAAGPYGTMILTMGTTGLRIGEIAGLQVGDFDPKRLRLRVRRTVSKGRVGGPKSHQARDVPLRPQLAAWLANLSEGRDRDDWLFTSARGQRPGGRTSLLAPRLNPDNWRRTVFATAAQAIGREGMHPHELRHTAASLAIMSGADVKAVQRMLGHASAAMTVDLYGHLFEQGLDDVAVRMDDLFPRALDS